MTEAAGDSVSRRTRGLDRAFEILEFLRVKRQPMRPNEIAAEIGAPRSSVYELVNLLLSHGMLDYQGGDGRVFLGRRLYFLGTAYAEQFDLMRECDRMLVRLAEETRETAQMCLLEGRKYTVAMMREGVRPFRISSNVGELVSIAWTASGRLLVSHLTDQQIIDLIPPEDFVLPNGRRMDPSEFISQVRQADRDGFFTFNSEVENFTHCFAVPVRQADGACIATLCLVTPREDGLRNRTGYLESLLSAANEISDKLGYQQIRDRSTARSG
ncbi:helix-turn-helix domain-containing protein [Shinella sp. AETb1-6]|jgi:DNA-binding IclR family transcriptional regulator|uniref:IclR family transcriptional regulator n=1 Tax=Shinella TaxID=323620 RepID=UPI00106EB5CA|nr:MULTISPECIES: IclR family transcriptional regulator [Shinella]MCD1262269.1 helix-turn-helix domain-containing protein [Shinella sumterensis]MXN53501.1 helix-turn-helix domain-containing protein [Shinella sp. AETb1-6]TFE97153.1 IclR family transcriptional regulator [Shinella sumterensis]UPA26377.1 IclR family transcriptional regulator [Shinella oryzae]WLS11014.1 IclR family transcriptional regulator [Shinella sumterensis]